MKKSGFAKGVIWTLLIGVVLVVILATAAIVAYNGYTDAALEASYSRGDTETTIKIEKKDKVTSEYASTELAKKEVNFTEDLIKNKKKLKFKEYGPFYGIKKNGIMVRGIHKGPKNEMAQTDYYGLFTKNNMFWKGYSKHSYNDGEVLYQYNEYKLDDKGNPIQDKDGIFQLVDSYVISADSFEKVKEYIHYDIELPFSFYDFKEPQTQIAKKEPSQTEKGLELLKQQVEWKVWVKHVDKDYRKQRPYTGESDHIIYDIDNGVYIINPKNPKDEAIFVAKEKCWKDYPNSKSGCLIDKINRLESQGTGNS